MPVLIRPEEDLSDACPNCEHPMSVHSIESGCHADWDYDENGHAQANGCECPLTLAKQYNPPREKDIP